MPLRYGSLFTGIGGFDLGFERAGMECAWQVERDKDCNRVLRRHWPHVQKGNDVCTVTPRDYSGVDLICGGFPCQDLSVAGKRKGLAGERSGLWHEYHRILAEFTPRWCVIENVPGLLSSHSGRDFVTLLRGLVELGYCLAWCVLDSQYFRVPQRRKRVFIVGSLGNGSCAEILFEPESVRGDSPPSRETGKEVAGTIGGSSQSGGFRTTDLDNNGAFVPCVAKPLGAHALSKGRGTDLDNTTYIPMSFQPRIARNGRGQPEEIVPALSGADCGATSDMRPCVAIPIQEIGKRQSGTAMNGVGHGKNGDPMYTLQRSVEHGVAIAFSQNQLGDVLSGEVMHSLSTNGNATGRNCPNVACFDERNVTSKANRSRVEAGMPCHTLHPGAPSIANHMMVRRLTPRECERLQGFPDDHTRWDADGKEISDSARYRMLGNAVTTYPAEWIGRRVAALA